MNPLLICLILRYHRDLKPSSSPSLEEDEGFSDWTQRRERQRQQRLQDLNQGTEEDDNDDEVTTKTGQVSIPSPSHLQAKEQEEVARTKQDVEWRQEWEEDKVQAEGMRREKDREEEEKRKELDPEVGGPQSISVMCSRFKSKSSGPSRTITFTNSQVRVPQHLTQVFLKLEVFQSVEGRVIFNTSKSQVLSAEPGQLWR